MGTMMTIIAIVMMPSVATIEIALAYMTTLMTEVMMATVAIITKIYQ
jgi:hypothetical protein